MAAANPMVVASPMEAVSLTVEASTAAKRIR
jgi:hypothetical protein